MRDNDELREKIARLEQKVKDLEGMLHVDECEALKYANKRQARKIREVCELNEKLTAELAALKKRRDKALPDGIEWPRYGDGTLVKPFDKVGGFDSGGVQKFVYTTSANGSWQLQDAEGHMLNVFPMVDGLNRVKRPPLMEAAQEVRS